MPAKKATSSKSASAPASNVWAWVGTDDLQVKSAASAKVRELTPPDAGEFGVEIIEGGADNSEHAARIVRNAIEAIQTLPFFGGQKVVWLKGANFLADTVTGRAQATTEALEELAALLTAGIPKDVQFVLSAGEVDKRRSFYLGLKKLARLEVFDLIDTSKSGWEEQVAGLIEDRADKYDLRFEPEALELFTMMAGEDTRQIDNELDKLDLYLGEGRRVATSDDVRAIVSQTKGGVIFELGNAIGHKNLPLALALVDQLLEQGESAIGILLAALVPRVRNMAAAKQIEERHRIKPGNYQQYAAALERLPAAETARLPKKKDGSGLNVFPLFLAAKEATHFTSAEVRRALDACLTANLRLVTSSLDPVIVLNQLLIRILSGGERGR